MSLVFKISNKFLHYLPILNFVIWKKKSIAKYYHNKLFKRKVDVWLSSMTIMENQTRLSWKYFVVFDHENR